MLGQGHPALTGKILMLIRRIALVLIMALCSTQATNVQATPVVTGMQLQQWCSNGTKPGGLDGLQCATYMLGFINGLNVADGFLDAAQKAYCLPPGLTAGQTILITNKFMNEHPEDLHRSAAEIVGRALYVAYACKRSNGTG
jgi:hypothetical protein